jgi:hypothetical protein
VDRVIDEAAINITGSEGMDREAPRR